MLTLRRNTKRDITINVNNLGANICNKMTEIKLCADDWNLISDYLYRIKELIRSAGSH